MQTPLEIAAFRVGASQPEIDTRRAATRLRNLLRLNSIFSIATGLIGLLAAGPVAGLLGVEQVWAIRVLGAGLIGFAATVFAVAGARMPVLRRWSLIISVNDLGWVTGTVAVAASGWLSTVGAIVMGLIGLVVLELGISQMRARARMIGKAAETEADLNESPPLEIVAFDRSTSGSAEQLWPVITDHQLYARLALNLKAAEGLTPNGPGFRRTCTDSAGRTWSETCTRWDPGRRFDVDIDIDSYPYPLQIMQGSWQVEPDGPDTSTVAMTFVFQPASGIYGRAFVPVMHLIFPPILRRIARGWEKAAAGERTSAGR